MATRTTASHALATQQMLLCASRAGKGWAGPSGSRDARQ